MPDIINDCEALRRQICELVVLADAVRRPGDACDEEIARLRTQLATLQAKYDALTGEKFSDRCHTALRAQLAEAERRAEEMRKALVEIGKWATGETEVEEGEDAEAALIRIDRIVQSALSAPAPSPAAGEKEDGHGN